MSALQLSYMPMINLDFFSSHIEKLKGTLDELHHKALCQGLSFTITELKIATKGIKELQDINIAVIKEIDFDGVYARHDFMKEEISYLYDVLKVKNDKNSKELIIILDELLDECAKYEWACGDLEHLLIEDKRAS